MLKIRNVKIADLSELVAIEDSCFPKEEAATVEAFKERIQYIPDSFFVAEEEGEIKGLVNGPVIENEFITDDLFDEIRKNPDSGGHQSVLGLAVKPNEQKKGIAKKLLVHFEKAARLKGRETITLTCKKELIAFYESLGYVNAGISDSQHGGVIWYNMVKRLKS